jgi:hypothetical protein
MGETHIPEGVGSEALNQREAETRLHRTQANSNSVGWLHATRLSGNARSSVSSVRPPGYAAVRQDSEDHAAKGTAQRLDAITRA